MNRTLLEISLIILLVAGACSSATEPNGLDVSYVSTPVESYFEIQYKSAVDDTVKVYLQCVPDTRGNRFEILKHHLEDGVAEMSSAIECDEFVSIFAVSESGVQTDGYNMNVLRKLHAKTN